MHAFSICRPVVVVIDVNNLDAAKAALSDVEGMEGTGLIILGDEEKGPPDVIQVRSFHNLCVQAALTRNSSRGILQAGSTFQSLTS